MRVSYYVQLLSFAVAILTPVIGFTVFGFIEEIFYVTAYAWGVGLGAAFWHRLTVEDRR